MNGLLLCLLIAVLLQYPDDVAGQFTAPPSTCPCDTITFECIVAGNASGATFWRLDNASIVCTLVHDNISDTAICNGFSAMFAIENTSNTSFSTSLSGTATPALNGTLVECFGPSHQGPIVGNSTIQIVGPPSVPTLSCDDISEDTNGAVSVTVSWTLSGGDSADFYLINITTNDPDPPYGGLLNISTASITQRELIGFQAGYEYSVTLHGINCGSQKGNESEPLTITPQGPPSFPILSCTDLSEDTNGALSVTVSWTLSGGDSANSYRINISTNDPQPPYGGHLNSTTSSVTLSGFQAGYEYNITVRGINCGSREGSESEPLTITPEAPATPKPEVCAVYDRTKTLQTILSTWDEVNATNDCVNCANRQDIRTSYELHYISSSGTSITTCDMDGTDCSNGVCQHELQDNITDSRCHPPVSQFNSENVTVTLTARNTVGRSNSSLSRSISVRNAVFVVVTNPANATVECTFKPGYNCIIEYGTNSSYSNLDYRDNSTTLDEVATITLTQTILSDVTYYFIASAESNSQCVRVRGTFQTDAPTSTSPVPTGGCDMGCIIGIVVGAVVLIAILTAIAFWHC